ncbi:hypothetical protein HC823_02440 [Candidatus Gracilibacteria bacterium]|nr:hypothetical protein [Candidatus Gracilibacteria bacterium]
MIPGFNSSYESARYGEASGQAIRDDLLGAIALLSLGLGSVARIAKFGATGQKIMKGFAMADTGIGLFYGTQAGHAAYESFKGENTSWKRGVFMGGMTLLSLVGARNSYRVTKNGIVPKDTKRIASSTQHRERVSVTTQEGNIVYYKIKQTPEFIEVSAKRDAIKQELFDLNKKVGLQKQKNAPVAKADLDKISQLNEQISSLNKQKQKMMIMDILGGWNKEKGIGKGQDNTVLVSESFPDHVRKFTHGNLDDLARADKIKTYYLKKYQLLKHNLGELIPDTKFLLGERGSEMKLITIQRRVKGRPFSELSKVERGQAAGAFEKAVKKYYRMLEIAGVRSKEFDLRLDIGEFSAARGSQGKIDLNDILNCESPNVMWDGKQIKFIDFGIDIKNSGVWNSAKEKVFEKLVYGKSFD